MEIGSGPSREERGHEGSATRMHRASYWALLGLYGLLLLPCLLLALPLMMFLVFVLLKPAHMKDQACEQCGRRAAFAREGEGRRSWTDLVVVEYQCPEGHTFTKEWTVAPWGD